MSPQSTSPLLRLPTAQWTDVISYLTASDLKSLRLSGSKESTGGGAVKLTAPQLTSHLVLRMDRAPFFLRNRDLNHLESGRWLANRRRLVINDANALICPRRVSYLISRGYLNSITQIVVHDCHAHAQVVCCLSALPNVKYLKLLDQGNPEERSSVQIRNDLELMVSSLEKMPSLQALDIEFDHVVSGRNLLFLQNLEGLKHLRLRGFDLSKGIENMASLTNLQSLHLCHGNFYSSPEDDVREEDLLTLMNLTNVKNLHLEGFDCLGETGLKPFSPSSVMRNLTLRHCQEMSQDCLPSVGRMTSLESLHIVNSAFDDIDIENFESENWVHLNSLQNLKRLSLFYVLVDQYDLLDLAGLTSLETLNIAFHDSMDQEGFGDLCERILPTFPSLRKLRIFSDEGGMEYSIQKGEVEIEFSSFNFGDEVELD